MPNEKRCLKRLIVQQLALLSEELSLPPGSPVLLMIEAQLVGTSGLLSSNVGSKKLQ